MSVGVVVDKDKAAVKKKQYDAVELSERNHQFYMDELKRVPGLLKLLANGTMRDAERGKGLKTTSDFSYDAATYASDHYRIAGDAGCETTSYF